MRIAVVLIAVFVFAALLGLDTGALLRLSFSWATEGPVNRWLLPSAASAIAALAVWWQKTGRHVRRTRAGSSASRRRPKVKSPQRSKA